MAEIDKPNGDLPSEPAPTPIIDIIDDVAPQVLCETSGYDAGLICTKGSQEDDENHLEDNGHCTTRALDTDALINEVIQDSSLMVEKEINDLTAQETEAEEEAVGGCKKILVSEDIQIPTCGSQEEKYLPKEELKDQVDGQLLSCQQGESLNEEEALMIEENTSTYSDKDDGEEPLSEEQENEENGPKDSLSLSPSDSQLDSFEEHPIIGNRPDISRHSYSRYDTVSYRKIRKGNTKQRIDEFESMMNV
ncbi:ermin isoform 1-T1 [Discoglossus pictus]